MESNLDLKISELDSEKNYQLISFSGDFDKAGHNDIREKLDGVIQAFSGKSLVFDFSGLNFINSEAIGYLIEIHTHLTQRGRELVIVGLKPNIQDIFSAIGIKEVIKIYSDLNDFLNS
ncbi:STAS domain-containing protein [Candidatus Peregrinibacteria bacterium]|nr:STAS domain-containing protein [Candidatus Peregrinibacteria bacterium]